jgi:hypothetical protein
VAPGILGPLLGQKGETNMIRPENLRLSENLKRRVLEKVREQGITCGSCGSNDFEVGDALHLGFLFLDEEHGTYMIALTCRSPGCDTPRTGIKLNEAEFLHDEEEMRDVR